MKKIMKITVYLMTFMLFLSISLAGYGTVLDYQKISDTAGNFLGTLNNDDCFGRSISSIGDLDNDGVEDLAVGAEKDDDGGTDKGAVWILFLNPNGTVKNHQKISATAGNFGGTLNNDDRFGRSISSIGDLDNDGVEELAVGAHRDDDGGTDKGAVWILFLNPDGTVKKYQKISATAGNFSGTLSDEDYFGVSVSSIGDLDNDGVEELAVGAKSDDDGGNARGAVWILFLNPDGTVKNYQKISDTVGGFSGTLDDGDEFGVSVSSIGDLDNNGIVDIAVGADYDDDGGSNRGAVWILSINSSIETATMPIYTNFISFPHTTNLSAVPDLTNVTNLTLETLYGMLQFPHNHSVNVSGQNLDDNIIFGDCYVSVNSSALDYTFNASAYLTLNNSDGHCGDDRIYYAPGVYDNADAIRQHDTVCKDCIKLIADNHKVKFRVYHFSSYAIGSNANLTIYDSYENSAAQPNADIVFYANYTNKSGSHISGATCTIYFDGNTADKHNMTDNGNNYNYISSFSTGGTHNYNITCSAPNYNTLSAVDDVYTQYLPVYSNFVSSPYTTNFSAVPDLTNVTNLTLETLYGMLQFPYNYSVNAEGEDYDSNVIIGDCYVSVNTSALDPSFNASAYLSFSNSDGHCGDNHIYKASGVYNNADAIRQQDILCEDCVPISFSNGHLVKFKVYHFSSYAIGSNANLTIYDSYENSAAQPNADIVFYANYTNKSGSHISGATCTIYFDGNTNDKHNMTDNGNNYNYTFSFSSAGTHNYNITCSATNYNTLSAVDDVEVSSVVPEFSPVVIFILLLGIILIIIRKR